MKVKKSLISVAIVGLLVSMLALPAIAVDSRLVESDKKFVEAISVNDEPSKVIRVMMMSVGGVETTETVISENDYQELKGIVNGLIDYFNENIEVFWQDFRFDADERATVAEKLNAASAEIRDVIPDFPIIDFLKLLNKLFEAAFPYPFIYSSIPIISVGYGKTIIPFYAYDMFIGSMIRPIFLNYVLGFSATMNFNRYPRRLEYADRLGAHRFTTFGFTGLYMNIGDLSVDIPSGITLLVGKSPFMTRIGPDFP